MAGYLYLQSEYSMLKSTMKLDALDELHQTSGYDKVFLTDENNLYAAYKFFLHPSKIKKYIGVKFTILHQEKKTAILAYATSQLGYENLIILTSLINLSEDKIIVFNDLIKYQQDLIFVTTGFESDVDMAIMNNQQEEALARLKSYKQGLKMFYVGLSLQTLKMEMLVAPILYKMAKQLDINLLPIHKTNYLKEDKLAYDALIKIDDINESRFDDADLSFKTKADLEQLFSEYQDVLRNIDRVFDAISFRPVKPTFELPKVFEEQAVDSKAFLKDLCEMGLKKRAKIEQIKNISVYQTRLDYELSTINQMGYNDYFLVVWDFVKYAKTNQIMVGPGRGSAAGSLVSYCLGITDVDPIKYDLLFERFLNPERISMPDIDLDFPDNRRDEVIQYVKEKYGKKRVLSITTFSTLQVKSSIRDICRTQNITTSETNKIVKQATSAYNITDTKTLELLELAKKIEGLPRQTGTHAAGIILSSEDLSRIIPFQKGASDLYQSQFEAADLEALGLLKIDFLGIRNLAIITNVIKLIETHKHIKIDIQKINMSDKKTYELLSSGDTQGIFQLESPGMRRVLTKLRPNTFEDIVAILALYRPGPMDNIDTYIERRNSKAFDYIDPSLEEILKPTYGIIIYQEQIMKIANTFANYTLAEADLLRRGVSKKNHDILENERKRFVQKSIMNQKDEALANKIYDYIVKFADYGFNRSHSVAYAVVAYQMAYLKANYFDAFMSVLLSSVSSNTDQVLQYIDQLKKRQIPVLKPDIRYSDFNFVLSSEGIIYPLIAIKNIGSQTVIKIKEERDKGPFKDYDDFKQRLKSELKEPVLHALIFSGALDCFGLNRKTLFETKEVMTDTYRLFVSDIVKKTYEEYALIELIEKESLVLGFNLSMSPLQAYDSLFKDKSIVKLSNLDKYSKKTLAYISKVKEITTKKGDLMAFIEVTDYQTTIEMTMFTPAYLVNKDKINSKQAYIMHIRSNEYGGLKFILERLEPQDDPQTNNA